MGEVEYIQLRLKLVWKRPVEERAVRPPMEARWTPRARCSACGEWKDAHLFPPDHRNTGRFGLHSHCHDCRADYARRVRQRHVG